MNSDTVRCQLRISFFIHTPKDPRTGVFGTVRHYVDYLNRHGNLAEIIGPEDFPWLARISSRWYTLLYSWAVAFFLVRLETKPDIVVFHSHSGWAFHALRQILPGCSRICTVTHFHGLEPLHFSRLQATARLNLRYRIMQGWIAPLVIRFSCRRSDAVHCLNSEERRYLVDHGWARPERVWHVHNGVPASFFMKRNNTRRVRKLLFVGQWLELKGIKSLVSAFETALKGHPDLRLYCVGTLQSHARVLADFSPDSRSAVVTLPRVTHEQIRQYLMEADAFVFPTLSEGFSVALLEAMASGLPIVTTPVAAARDILEDEKSALLVPVNDDARIVEAIGRLIREPALAERLGRGAQSAARYYEWEIVCNAYRQQLLGSRLRQGDKSGPSHKTSVVSDST